MSQLRFRTLSCGIVVSAILMLPSDARANYPIDSGHVENTDSGWKVIYEKEVESEDAEWIRLNFDSVLLSGNEADGTASYLRITSLADDAVQTLRASHLVQWDNSSAFFNGSAVNVEIVALAGTGLNRVIIDEPTAGPATGEFLETSFCEQRRIPSADPRIGRSLNGSGTPVCTAFIIDDRAHSLLSAGHCEASGLQTIEFNVPLSTSSGTAIHPDPSEQYAVDPESFDSEFGLEDWAHFGCFPNTETGLTPYEAQGDYFRLASSAPASDGQRIQVTGFGVSGANEPGEWNRTQKTSFGTRNEGGLSSSNYATVGDSGSPMIQVDTCEVIGIVTTPLPCSEVGSNNIGTSNLQTALANPQGVSIPDCNTNGINDDIDIAGSTSEDCTSNGIPDECEPDCNTNGIPDSCDIQSGTSTDCGQDGIPDECGLDCNDNQVSDDCDIALGTSFDCNCTRIPDECDVAAETSIDCNSNSIPDECEPDCNRNAIADECDISAGTSIDCNGDLKPDECDIADGIDRDCNGNAILDSCELSNGTSTDCNSNSILDECDLSGYGELLQANSLISLVGDIKQYDSSSSQFIQLFPTTSDPLVLGSLLGIAFDGRGHLWLGDETEHKIHVVDAFSGAPSDSSVTQKSGGLFKPWDITIGPNGNLFVANVGSNGTTATGVLQYDGITGDFLGVFASDSLIEPTGLTFGPKGNLFVCDGTTAEILKFDGDNGTLISVFASTNGVDLIRPTALSFDQDTGDLYVIDNVGDDVVIFDGTTGDWMGFLVANFGVTLFDLEFGPDGELYVSEQFFATIHKLDHLTGDVITTLSYDNGLDPTRIAFRPPATDCNFDNVLDPCEIAAGTSQDCNSNAIPDQCEVYQDCNTNSIRDICDIASEFSTDCDGDNVPDECEADCNTNGIADDCDIVAGTSTDCNGNTIPDLCEAFFDCNSNSIKDMCDIADGTSGDCDNDGIPDECESDCNENTVPDDCEIAAGSSADCDGDGTPDECEPDCNSNGIADDCDIAGSTSRDCNDNLIPDECDVSAGTSIDCNANIVPDECEICLNDCNTNSVPDDCDVAGTTSSDVNSNDIPDECEDCNTNGTLDFNEDCDTNGYAFRHDYDRDGDHDLRDFWYFQRCFNTNGVGTNGVTVADCLCAFDWDTNGVRDSIIDLNDFLSLVDDESFGLEPQIACWYAAQDQECTAGGQMEMLMGGGGGESQMMMAESEESFEQEAEEGPPEITVEYADLEFELRPGGSEEAAEILEPNTVYELHYVADSNYVNDYVLEVVATTSAQGLTAVVQAPSGDWSATGNFVFEDVVTAYGSLIPAPGYPEGYYRTDWILDTFFPYSGKAAGEAGHLCNITTGSEGELELVLHMIWFDLENSHLKIMEAVLAFDVEADD